MTVIARRLTLDAGHRVPGHQGQCRNLHGHTYTIEVEVAGPVPRDGMVIDFGVVKAVMVAELHDPWDHAFLLWRQDEDARVALAVDPTWKVAILDLPPTAENLALIAAQRLSGPLATHGVTLSAVTVWETPNCWARWDQDAVW